MFIKKIKGLCLNLVLQFKVFINGLFEAYHEIYSKIFIFTKFYINYMNRIDTCNILSKYFFKIQLIFYYF